MQKNIALVIVSFGLLLNGKSIADQVQEKREPQSISLAQRSDLKIRFIDSFEVMRQSKDGQEAGKSLEVKREKLAQDIQLLEKAYTQAVNDFKAKTSTMNEVAREKAEKDIRKLEADYKNKLQESEYEMKLAMQKATDQLGKDVEVAAAAVAQKDAVDVIIDIRTGQAVYAADKGVLTKELVAEMDKKREMRLVQAKKETPTTMAASKGDSKSKATA